MVSTGYWQLCIIQPGLRANFSRESLQPSHWGRRWVVQHPQLTLWDRVRGMQHSLKACPTLVKEDCAAKGFVGMFRRAYPGPPFGSGQGNVRFPSPPPLSPPPYDSHFPRRPISGQCGSPQAGLLVVRCQLPDARGRLPTGQLPQLKQVYPSASTPTPSRVTCVLSELTV